MDRSTAEFCVWLEDEFSVRSGGLRNLVLDTRHLIDILTTVKCEGLWWTVSIPSVFEGFNLLFLLAQCSISSFRECSVNYSQTALPEGLYVEPSESNLVQFGIENFYYYCLRIAVSVKKVYIDMCRYLTWGLYVFYAPQSFWHLILKIFFGETIVSGETQIILKTSYA
jgi:hypothetical protein